MKRHVKLLRLLLLTLLACASSLLLTSCTSNANPQSQSSKTITFYSWDDPSVMASMIKAFEKDNPGYKISISHKPPVDGYNQGLQTQLLSGTAADVFVMGAENRINIMKSKSAVDLTNLPLNNNLNSANKTAYGENGKTYAASISSWGGGIAYNEALLKKVGYTKFPNTWNGFIELCLKLKKAGVTPLYEGAQSGNFMVAYGLIGAHYNANGGNQDNAIFAGKTTFSKQYAEPLNMWHELMAKNIYSSAVLGLSDDQIVNEFANGNVAMVGMGPWSIATVRKSNPKLKFKIAPIPYQQAGQEYLTGAPSPGYSINAAARNKPAAEKFVTWMTTPAAAKVLNEGSAANNMYTTKGTEEINSKLDPALQPITKLVEAGKIYLPATSYPEYQNQMTQQLKTGLQEVVQGKLTVKQLLQQMDDLLNGLR